MTNDALNNWTWYAGVIKFLFFKSLPVQEAIHAKLCLLHMQTAKGSVRHAHHYSLVTPFAVLWQNEFTLRNLLSQKKLKIDKNSFTYCFKTNFLIIYYMYVTFWLEWLQRCSLGPLKYHKPPQNHNKPPQKLFHSIFNQFILYLLYWLRQIYHVKSLKSFQFYIFF